MKNLSSMISPLKKTSVCLILFLITIMVTYPKFAQVTWLESIQPSQSAMSDDYQYFQYVEFFRGGNKQNLPTSPFSYRPLTPYLASFLPFNPRIAINIINVTALYLSTILIFMLATRYWDGLIPLSCALLYLISFPSFYYCANGRVDSLSILIITLLLTFTLNQRVVLFGLCFMIGLLAKETIVISLLPFIFYNHEQSNLKKSVIIFVALLTFFLLEQHVIKVYGSSGSPFSWKLNFNVFFENLSRPHATISFILSLGLPGFISLYYLFKKWHIIIEDKVLLTLYSGFFSSIGLYLFAFGSAYADGRFIWVSYPYICLISGFYLADRRQNID